MNRETNLYLRSILGREKAALIADRDNLSRSAKETSEKLDQIGKEIKSLNEGLGLLKSLPNEPTAPEKQDTPSTTPVETPAAPRLCDDTANRIRKALGLYVDSLRKAAANVDELLCLFPDAKKLIQARFDAARVIEQACDDLNEFNKAYPEKEDKQ